MSLTEAQINLLQEIATHEKNNLGRVIISGSRVRTARSLEHLGLAVIKTEGEAWTKGWYQYVEAVES